MAAGGSPLVSVEGANNFRSPAIVQVMALAARVAGTDATVLLLGDTGAGKDWLAGWIHTNSRRARGPFVAVNCAAIPHDLAESQLFGHERGAFSGATCTHQGLFEQARGGTLFLNEVGELAPALQAKFLSFLDTRCFRRLGGEAAIPADVRILAATNRDPAGELGQNGFRADLFYRLQGITMTLPPLRERREDLPVLVEILLDRLARELHLEARPGVDGRALRALQARRWPGNIRELENVLRAGLVASSTGVIRCRDLPCEQAGEEWKLLVPFQDGRNLHEVLGDVAGRLIAEALRRSGTIAEAARLLGITRDSLVYRMRKNGNRV